MNEQDIADQFKNIATVTNVKLIRDKVKNEPVGYGFVEFPNWQTAKEVFQTLNG
jgi:RNA recognition motif-containing protein